MESYYQKKYEINPKIRELIEKKTGKKYGLSNVEIENILANVVDGKNISAMTMTEEEKQKIIGQLWGLRPDGPDPSLEKLQNIYKFLSSNYNQDERVEYMKNIYQHSHYGEVYDNSIRLYCEGMSMFISTFINDTTILRGIAINTKFIADVKKFGFDPKVDEKTWKILDESYVDELISKIKEIAKTSNMSFSISNGIILLAHSQENTDDYFELNHEGFTIYNIPEVCHTWE